VFDSASGSMKTISDYALYDTYMSVAAAGDTVVFGGSSPSATVCISAGSAIVLASSGNVVILGLSLATVLI
jgi:hypothetical protein